MTKLKKICLFSIFLFSILGLICQSVQATESITSDTLLKVISGIGPTAPLDPLNPQPNQPIIPEQGQPTGSDGSLAIDYISNFQFGTQSISSKNKTYYAQAQKYQNADGQPTSGPNFIQITDVRGTWAGWKVSVKQNVQFKYGEKELKNAELSMTGGEMVSYNNQTSTPDVVETVTLRNIGYEYEIITASENQGMGTWIYRFGSDTENGSKAVQLSVPGSSVKYTGQYITKLTWVLKDTP